MKLSIRLAPLVLAAMCVTARAEQVPDPSFDATVKQKAYAAKEHPLVVIDEAHNNEYTASSLFAPLGQLLKNDGYEVQAGTEKFQPQTLRAAKVLIVANARPAENGGTEAGGTEQASPPPPPSPSAFTDAECDIVRDWVSGGGSLLLIADHTPFGNASAELAKRFGVSMGKGFVFDPANSQGSPTHLTFTAAQFGDHPIIRGRTAPERVKRVMTFSGQSLSVPGIATPLLKFSPTAYESENEDDLRKALDAVSTQGTTPKRVPYATPAVGRAQVVALKFGSGRVVIAGEAALFSAQIVKSEGGSQPDTKVGMNVGGSDDRQFVLNVLHWLSRAL